MYTHIYQLFRFRKTSSELLCDLAPGQPYDGLMTVLRAVREAISNQTLTSLLSTLHRETAEERKSIYKTYRIDSCWILSEIRGERGWGLFVFPLLFMTDTYSELFYLLFLLLLFVSHTFFETSAQESGPRGKSIAICYCFSLFLWKKVKILKPCFDNF